MTTEEPSSSSRLADKYGTELARCPWAVQMLAALLYDDFRSSETRPRERLKHGAIFILAARSPALAEVREAALQRTAPPQWPAPATRSIVESGPAFWSLIDTALRFTEHLDIRDGGAVIHAAALVLQTVVSGDSSRCRSNDTLLRSAVPEARRALSSKAAASQVPPNPFHKEPPADEAVPSPATGTPAGEDQARTDVRRSFDDASSRPDETVGVHAVPPRGLLELRLATHVGPPYANLRENQDAAAAEAIDGCVVFAVADGVSTSYGSRFAAWTAVRAAVAHLAVHARATVGEVETREVLRGAAAAARQRVTDCLQHALTPDLDEGSWQTIRGAETLPISNARRFMENTFSRKMPSIGPAFASTLVAGVVYEPRGDRSARASVIRIGDGTVEVWRGADNSVRSLFDVDNAETVISTAICPGPVGDDAVASAQFACVDLEPRDDLVVSSDGLTRGHSDAVVTTLRNLVPASFTKTEPGRSALEVLAAAAAAADDLNRQDRERRLFEDNLALVRITVRRR